MLVYCKLCLNGGHIIPKYGDVRINNMMIGIGSIV